MVAGTGIAVIEALTGISLSELFAIWAIIFVAGFVRGLTGIGLAVVLVPLVNLVLPPERTVLLAILIGCLAGLMGYRAAWRNVDKPLIVTMTVATIAATPLGLYLLFQTPEESLKNVLPFRHATLNDLGFIPIVLTLLSMR